MNKNKIQEIVKNKTIKTERLFIRRFNLDDSKVHYRGNEASGCVMKKCGMKLEGLFPKEKLIKRIYVDVFHYGILSKEFNDN